MNEKMVAKELTKLANMIMAFKGNEELETEVKKLKELSDAFQDANKQLISEAEAAKATAKGIEDKLKEKYNAWKVKDVSGFLQLRKSVLELAETCLDKGEKLDDFIKELEDFSIKKRDSDADSYKMKYEMLVSTLHKNGEYQKYAKILDSSCAKIITEMKTGLSLLDDKVDDWDEKVKELAEERGLDWKGLIEYQFTRNTSKKKASLIEDIAEKIQAGLDKAIIFIDNAISKIADKITGHAKSIEEAGKIVDTLVTQTVTASKKVVADDKSRSYDWAKLEFHANNFSKIVSEVKKKVYDGDYSGEEGMKIVIMWIDRMRDILKK